MIMTIILAECKHNYFSRIVCAKQEEGFHLDLDDFLMGLLTMCNELVNLIYQCNIYLYTAAYPRCKMFE